MYFEEACNALKTVPASFNRGKRFGSRSDIELTKRHKLETIIRFKGSLD